MTAKDEKKPDITRPEQDDTALNKDVKVSEQDDRVVTTHTDRPGSKTPAQPAPARNRWSAAPGGQPRHSSPR
jgi:hypothetical protein